MEQYYERDATLTSLMINNSQFEEFKKLYLTKLKTISLFLKKEEFINQEIKRITTEFILPIKVTYQNGTPLRGFIHSKYTQEAYNWLKSGHDWKIDQIITSAKAAYFATFPGGHLNEDDFIKSIIHHIEKGTAYILYEKFLKDELESLKHASKKPLSIRERRRIPIPNKVRALLQKEINSICALCPSQDVDHFEIHHIDENPSNNIISNLLMVCPTCHSKITKGDISRQVVIEKKISLQRNVDLEIVQVIIDANCSWENQHHPYAFYKVKSNKSQYPILDFTLINHFRKTIILRNVKLQVKYLPKGLSGILIPGNVPMLGEYRIFIDGSGGTFTVKDFQPIQVRGEQAFRFKVEIAESNNYMPTVPKGRIVLSFFFEFSSCKFLPC
jgi:hypothetical protein